jgi:hypothetical protein
MCQHVSGCSHGLNWNRARVGNNFRPIKFVSISSRVFVNQSVVIVRTFLISRSTVLCRERCVFSLLPCPPHFVYITLPACTLFLRLDRLIAYTLLTRKPQRRLKLLLCTWLTDRQWSGYRESGSPERPNTPLLNIHSTHSTLFGFLKPPFLIDEVPWALHWIRSYAILDIRGRNEQAQIE